MGPELTGDGRPKKTDVEKLKVLIVDDSSAARHGLKSILGAYSDIEVVGEAVDGLEAVEKAAQLEPEVILMDAQMPRLDGVEATLQIKGQWPNVKILFLAVHASDIEPGIGAGADGYVMKDCTREDLIRAVRQLGRLN